MIKNENFAKLFKKTLIRTCTKKQWQQMIVFFNSIFYSNWFRKKNKKNRLIFNYHYIYENLQKNTMRLFKKTQKLISNSKWKMFFEIDIKRKY